MCKFNKLLLLKWFVFSYEEERNIQVKGGGGALIIGLKLSQIIQGLSTKLIEFVIKHFCSDSSIV